VTVNPIPSQLLLLLAIQLRVLQERSPLVPELRPISRHIPSLTLDATFIALIAAENAAINPPGQVQAMKWIININQRKHDKVWCGGQKTPESRRKKISKRSKKKVFMLREATQQRLWCKIFSVFSALLIARLERCGE
jgi:hypothetical protein